MDSDELVKDQIDAGREILGQLAQDGFEVDAAGWIRSDEDDGWLLCVATPLVEKEKLASVYILLQESLQRLNNINLSLSNIKLVGPADSVAKTMSDILGHYQGRTGILHYGGRRLGSGGAVLYSEPTHAGRMTDREIMQRVLDLMDRSGGFENSTITLTDGTAFLGVPIGLELLNNAITIKFVVDHVRSPENHRVSEIAEIR